MADRNYGLNITVSSRSEGGAGESRSDVLRNAGRKRTQDHVEKMRVRAPAGSLPKDPAAKGMMELSKQIAQMTKVQQQLLKQVIVLNKNMGRGGGRSGGGDGGGSGGRSGFGGVEGLGSVGASVPFLGAAVAAAGYVVSKVLEVGHRNIEVSSRQFRTAGIGGFQGGMAGVYGPTELGTYAREQAIARGRIGTGAITNENAGYALKIAELTGMNPGEMGRLQGLMSGGQPGVETQRLRQIVQTTGGVGAQTPEILNMVLDRLTEAVSEGIDDSDIGPQIAKSLAPFISVKGAAGTRATMAVMKSAQGVVGQVQRGQTGGVMGFTLRNQALKEIEGSKDLQAKYGITDMKNMQPYQMEGILQRHIAENPETTMNALRSIYESTGRNKDMFRTALQGVYMPGTTEGQARILSEQFAAEEKRSPWMKGYAGMDTTATAQKNMGRSATAQIYQSRSDVMALSEPAQLAGDAVMILNKAMVDLAGVGADGAVTALKGLNFVLKELSDTAVGTAKDIQTGNSKGLLQRAANVSPGNALNKMGEIETNAINAGVQFFKSKLTR